MPVKAWLPAFEPGAGRQRLPGVQRAAPLARCPEEERSGPRHFAGFRRKTESVIVGSYTFAESAVPPSLRAPNATYNTHPRKPANKKSSPKWDLLQGNLAEGGEKEVQHK